VLLLAPVLLSGQATTAAQNRSAGIDLQFAEINVSLTGKADELLVNADAAVPAKINAGEMLAGDHDSSSEDLSPRRMSNPASVLSRFESLRPQIESVLQSRSLPAELAAIILVESGANPAALSPKGARGLWQLMPETARRYGLTVDAIRDERLDIQKSTEAAARYLSDLHVQFGSWPLVLAAYNTGEQNLQRAMDRSHSAEFPVLSSLGLLPMETRNYVPAVVGAMRSIGRLPASLGSTPNQHGVTAFAFTTP
jgi:soluble lytic murein transglycosylase-like protein